MISRLFHQPPLPILLSFMPITTFISRQELTSITTNPPYLVGLRPSLHQKLFTTLKSLSFSSSVSQLLQHSSKMTNSYIYNFSDIDPQFFYFRGHVHFLQDSRGDFRYLWLFCRQPPHPASFQTLSDSPA